ncbi:MAG: hypothetical protein K2W95_00955 [Candidatus Obscuribacterales bacterium]|nr:hypothetical protein [Candidatus Obscuribacterales bacterium]
MHEIDKIEKLRKENEKALETLALDSPNLFKFDELNQLSEAVDKWDKWCEEEK